MTSQGRASRALHLVAPALAGAFMALASPPTDFFPALWLGLAAFAFTLDAPSPSRWWAGAARGLAFGLAVNLVACRFVPAVVTRFTSLPWPVAALALVLLALEQSLVWVVAAMVRAQLARRGVPGWAAFAAGVYAGAFVPVVLPWTVAGALSPWPSMVQLADGIGERGVVLLIALSSGLLAAAARAAVERGTRRAVIAASASAALPLAMFAYGLWRMARIDAVRDAAPTVTVGLLQPSVDAHMRWDETQRDAILGRLVSLTKSAESRGASLTVWPEASYPFPVAHWARRCPQGDTAVLPSGVKGPVLFGLIMQQMGGETFNSAAVCTADGELTEPYDKVHLLPFGETIPVVGRMRVFHQAFPRSTRLVAGRQSVLQTAGPIRAGVLNCLEDVLPGAGREAMQNMPNLLVNVTNDAWFRDSFESEFHLRFAALRAVEERRDLVRSVNFGPTSWIDANGRVRARYGDALPAAILAHPALLETPRTPFGRWGDAPTALLTAAALGALARTTKRKERRTPRPSTA